MNEEYGDKLLDVIKEHVEQLDELSARTLGSYLNKQDRPRNKRGPEGDDGDYMRASRNRRNAEVGKKRAIKKLVNKVSQKKNTIKKLTKKLKNK